MRRPDLVPDCGSCAALCCVATSFQASEDFAFDKPAGVVCRHLARDRRCTIHDALVERGMRGCAAYDCYGAGQRATRAFAGLSGAAAPQRSRVFLSLRSVHELLWLLTEALALCPAPHAELAAQLAREIAALDALASGPVAALLELDPWRRERDVLALLRRVGVALGGRQRAADQRA